MTEQETKKIKHLALTYGQQYDRKVRCCYFMEPGHGQVWMDDEDLLAYVEKRLGEWDSLDQVKKIQDSDPVIPMKIAAQIYIDNYSNNHKGDIK